MSRSALKVVLDLTLPHSPRRAFRPWVFTRAQAGPKSEIQASLFGGSAGRPYDPCYHRACDTIENINRDVLEQNTRALVRALNAAAIAARAPSTPSQKAVDLPEPNL